MALVADFSGLDALPPDTLRELYQAAIDEHWDTSTCEASLAQERQDRDELRAA